ncbi:Do family serine endopeptidase [Acidobacteriota bacterium]
MKKTLLITGISFIAGLFIAGLIFVYFPETKVQTSNWEEPAALASNLYAAPSLQAQAGLNFASIAERIGPTVVGIEVVKMERRQSRGGFGDGPSDDFWDRFFGTPRDQEYRSTAGGTGFFISDDGYILTNNHIVENAIKITVTSLQGNEYTAELIGTDPNTDIALIKVNGSSFPYANLGDSDRLMVGEWVLAIGNPLGFAHTVTAGIVSAKGRQLSQDPALTYQDFIQTDAAINRGNSGGPLVNMQGEVVGITSMIYTPTGGNIGIGFAIPSDLTIKIVTQLKETGKVVRGYLGISLPTSDIDDELQEVLNLKSKKGAMIHSVEPGTPADKAGLKPLDIIIKINGLSVENNNDLLFKIADIRPGTKVDLVAIRDGEEKEFSVKMGTRDDTEAPEAQTSTDDDIGYSVDDLTSQIAGRYGFQTQEGVLIMSVSRYSEAEEEGIRPGDIILEVNRQPVKNKRDFEKIIKKIEKGRAYLLLLSREGQRRAAQQFFVTLRIPE